MWFKNLPPPPPVPARLREMLKDYPELIQRVQDGLNRLVSETLNGSYAHPFHVFEKAIWRLEDTLDIFIDEAQRDLKSAEASGDSEVIQQAESKASLMRRARRSGGGMMDLQELSDYFIQYGSAFQ
jgi:hypothetical protein